MRATTDSGPQHQSSARRTHPVPLGRAHRLLIATVVAGAVVIAGIGFAGSYAAVRELAIQKGFGNFSYVFPIGIDAGICVLLALDLLLTWIRIPFPLLRQTAWLLTVATIAFNGAAAWPDPLGVGMHAVIPILFVVSVEAARHAIGRIADITADKHMEGVRLTRWLLSPIPTFLLWRRMKLWELRSYEQVIKLEQDRLVYQARLNSRFGRAWRRKAPIESLMPLRLAKYGVPLAQTAPSGLAAAGIEPVLLPPAPAAPTPVETAPLAALEQSAPQSQSPTAPADQSQQQAQPSHAESLPEDGNPWFAAFTPQEIVDQGGYGLTHASQEQDPHGYEEQQSPPRAQHAAAPSPENDAHISVAEAAGDFTPDQFFSPARDQLAEQHASPAVEQFGHYPESSILSRPVLDSESAIRAGSPSLPVEEEDGFVGSIETSGLRNANSESGQPLPSAATAHPHTTRPEPGLSAHAAARTGQGLRRAETTPELSPGTDQAVAPAPGLSTVDQYFLAWHRFQQRYSREPNSNELSANLAEQNTVDREGRPIKPKALIRYFLEFRIYAVWAEHRATTPSPIPDHVVKVLAERGVTAQYNRPIQTPDLERRLAGFERRWHTLNHHSTVHPPGQPSSQDLPASSSPV